MRSRDIGIRTLPITTIVGFSVVDPSIYNLLIGNPKFT
jgi:hypothetical protein